MSTVFVTGANGYIGQHLVKKLLEEGYKVIGSVRSQDKGRDLAAKFGDHFSYEVVPDLSAVGGFDQVLQNHQEIEGFFHSASPATLVGKDIKDEILKPAIEGTKNVLQSVKKYGPNIKRMVITSSIASMRPNVLNKEDALTEDMWCDVTYEQALLNISDAYRYSKTQAELAAWDFVKNENPQFTLNCINPAFVFGPQAFDSDVKDFLNSSGEFINRVLKIRPGEPIPSRIGACVDIRDVASAHIIAYRTEKTNLRLLLATERFEGQSILDVINEEFPQLGLPKGNPGKYPAIENASTINKDKTLEVLKEIDFIPARKSIFDAVNQIIKVRS